MLGDLETKYFYALTPEVIDNSLVIKGFRPSGRVLALNSLENRVYEVEVAGRDNLIVKFYRPGRWSKNAILEEHRFLFELTELEISVVAPLQIENESLFTCPLTGFFYAIFPKIRGRLKDELDKEEIKQIGRMIARIHNAGSTLKFKDRPIFLPENYIDSHFETLRSNENLPKTLVVHYLTMANQLSSFIKPQFNHFKLQCIHGDLHRGNILWTNTGPMIVDFDDSVTGPRIQDLWLLLPGRDEYSRKDQELFLESYHTMARETISLTPFMVESLRSIRMIHFNGWIARRFSDPTFKRVYSHFESANYWETQLLDIKEQVGILQDLIST